MKGRIRSICSIILVAVLVTGMLLSPLAWFPQEVKAAGAGTVDDPYVITTPAELYAIRNNLSAHYKLGNDIDLVSYENWEPLGSVTVPFTGSLDGNGYTISNLKITRATSDYVGLFGAVKGNISRTNLTAVTVRGNNFVGGLLGAIDSGQVEDSTVAGNVIGNDNVGGLGGAFRGTSEINSSSTNIFVTGRSNEGGLIGSYTSSSLAFDNSAAGQVFNIGTGRAGGLIGTFSSSAGLRNSHASANVIGQSSAQNDRSGGLIGELLSGKVEYCYATGNVSYPNKSSFNAYGIGGLVGYSMGVIEKSYATGETFVDAISASVGGLVGVAAGGSIINNYVTGKVTASPILPSESGSFVGLSKAELRNNYSAAKVVFPKNNGSSFLGKNDGGTFSGNYYDLDIVGISDGTGATAKHTEPMKTRGTFIDWDFDHVWIMDEGVSYPKLRPYVVTYTVAYNGNSSSSGLPPTDSNLYPAESPVTVAGNTGLLQRTGFVFAGWNSKANGTGEDYAPGSSFNMITGNLTLYARWVSPTYTIESIEKQVLAPLTVGYNPGAQETKTVVITRTGTGDLMNLNVQLSGADAGSFELAGPSATMLNDETPSTTFTVKAKDHLPAETYGATVTIMADQMAEVSFTVEQVVNPKQAVKGDANGDGIITPADILLITMHMNRKIVLTPDQFQALDMNDDEVLDSKDVKLLMEVYLGITGNG